MPNDTMPSMNRPARLLSQVMIVIWLTLCAAMAFLWARGQYRDDEVFINADSHLLIVGSFPQHLNFIAYRAADYRGPSMRFHIGVKRVRSMPEFWLIRNNSNNHRIEFSVPWWIPLLLCMAPPAAAAARSFHRRKRRVLGLCVECGYDLRASAGRCPECGAPSEVVR
jgi:hypothetical protein